MEEDKNKNVNQYAMIWNYYGHVENVHNHFEGAASKEDLAESSSDKAKRDRLTKTNDILKVGQGAGEGGVDILKLYRYIEKYFVSEIVYKYEWYALRRFLERNKLLRDCDNVAFANHMNQKEWFAHAKKSCEANEMNTYNFLASTPPDGWLSVDIPFGSKATQSAVSRIYKCFYELEDNKKELMI